MMWPDLKETELYLRTGGGMTGAGCGSSRVRPSRTLSRTKKVGGSVSPSVHLAVPDFSSVTSRRRSLATTWLEQGVWVRGSGGLGADGWAFRWRTRIVTWVQGTAVSLPANTAREQRLLEQSHGIVGQGRAPFGHLSRAEGEVASGVNRRRL